MPTQTRAACGQRSSDDPGHGEPGGVTTPVRGYVGYRMDGAWTSSRVRTGDASGEAQFR
jgi:hypothetical protein